MHNINNKKDTRQKDTKLRIYDRARAALCSLTVHLVQPFNKKRLSNSKSYNFTLIFRHKSTLSKEQFARQIIWSTVHRDQSLCHIV